VHPGHSMHFEHSEYSVAGDSEYSDFEHLTTNFHTENIAQPPPHERTLREMTAPDFTYESLCIQYPDEGVPYVLKTGLIHLLPKFHGLIGEDPHKHLKEFHIVCSTMKPPDVQEDHIFLKAFPHSLEWQKIDYTTLLPGPFSARMTLRLAILPCSHESEIYTYCKSLWSMFLCRSPYRSMSFFAAIWGQ